MELAIKLENIQQSYGAKEVLQIPELTVYQNDRIGIVRQLAYQLTGSESVLVYLMKKTDYPEKLVRSILHNLGFSQEEIRKPIAVLSGGEATRLQLALVFLRPANILVLDEPTNFIDLATVEALEELIRAYPGTVLFTSHDQAFVEQVASQIYEMKDKQLVERL